MGREENGVAPPQRRFRGKYRQPAWRRYEGQPVAVMVLELPVTDPRTLRRLANLYAAAWHIKRAVQRDARARVNAYWAARCPQQWAAQPGLPYRPTLQVLPAPPGPAGG